MGNIWLYSYRIKEKKKKTCLLVFPILREHLYTFSKCLPPLSEAHTASFVGTIHSDVEHNEISDPEADHMHDSLKQLWLL